MANKMPETRHDFQIKAISDKNDIEDIFKKFSEFNDLVECFQGLCNLQPVNKLTVDMILCLLGSGKFEDAEVFNWILSCRVSKISLAIFRKQFDLYRELYYHINHSKISEQNAWMSVIKGLRYCTPFCTTGWGLIFGRKPPPEIFSTFLPSMMKNVQKQTCKKFALSKVKIGDNTSKMNHSVTKKGRLLKKSDKLNNSSKKETFVENRLLKIKELQWEISNMNDILKEKDTKLEIYEKEIKILQLNLSTTEDIIKSERDFSKQLQNEINEMKLRDKNVELNQLSSNNISQLSESTLLKCNTDLKLQEAKEILDLKCQEIDKINAEYALLKRNTGLELQNAKFALKCQEIENINANSSNAVKLVQPNNIYIAEIDKLKEHVSHLEKLNNALLSSTEKHEKALIEKECIIHTNNEKLNALETELDYCNSKLTTSEDELQAFRCGILAIRRLMNFETDIFDNTLSQERKSIEELIINYNNLQNNLRKLLNVAGKQIKYINTLQLSVVRMNRDSLTLKKKSKALKKIVLKFKKNFCNLQNEIKCMKSTHRSHAQIEVLGDSHYVKKLEAKCCTYFTVLKEEFSESTRQHELQMAMYLATAQRYREQQERIGSYLTDEKLF